MERLLILIFIWLSLSGCTHTKYIEVPIESTHTSINYKNTIDSTYVKDSIYVYDSIFIKEKGDTIFQFKFRDRVQYLYLDKIKVDTFTLHKEDTVTITKPVIVEQRVEVNVLYWWQKILMGIGILSIIVLAIFIYLKMK